MDFPTVKLLDYAERTAELEQSENPFALVVLAHLRTLQTKDQPQARKAFKKQLIQLANDNGGRDNVSALIANVVDSFPARKRIIDKVLSWFS